MTKKKILVVDDDGDLRWTLVSFLVGMGYTISEAKSGNEAYSYLEKNKVDLVISDIEMLDGNGLELGERLLKKNSPPPLILMSGHIMIDEYDLKTAGAICFLPKPFDPKTLLTTLETFLQSA